MWQNCLVVICIICKIVWWPFVVYEFAFSDINVGIVFLLQGIYSYIVQTMWGFSDRRTRSSCLEAEEQIKWTNRVES